MRRAFLFAIFCLFLACTAMGQTAENVTRPEEKQKEQHAIAKEQNKKAQRTSIIEFRGQRVFDEKELRSQLKEQIATVDQFGLTPARADDVAFFLEVFYRKHGYVKVSVHYTIES